MGPQGPQGPSGDSGVVNISESINPGYITVEDFDGTIKEISVGTALSIYEDNNSVEIPVLGVNPYNMDELKYNLGVYIDCSKGVLMGAAWNDYAEFRSSEAKIDAGLVVYEKGDDLLDITHSRLMPGCSIVSDTFGFAIGKTDKAQTPVATCGRVLAYPAEPHDIYKPGDAVCSAPDGKVSKMTRDEIKEYPDCIIGYVSSVPTYDTWEPTNTAINNRIWIKIK